MDIILEEDAWEIERQLLASDQGIYASIKLEQSQADRLLGGLPSQYLDLLQPGVDHIRCCFGLTDLRFRDIPFLSLPLAHVLSSVGMSLETMQPSRLVIGKYRNYLLPFVNKYVPRLSFFRMVFLETCRTQEISGFIEADFIIIEFLGAPSDDTTIEIKRRGQDSIDTVFALSDLVSTPYNDCIFLMPLKEHIVDFEDILIPAVNAWFLSLRISSDVDAVLLWSF